MLVTIIKNITEKTRKLGNYIQTPYFFLSTFWLFVTSATFSYILWDFQSNFIPLIKGIYLQSSFAVIFLGIVTLFVFIGLFVFVVNPSTQLNKQKIHGQPSWVFYTYWALINAFIFCAVFSLTTNAGKYWIIILCVPPIIICAKWINELFDYKIDLTFKRFASGAVGIEDDKLDFNFSAKNAADGLRHLKSYVSVVGLYGGLGFGKSSYARMIIENFDTAKTLYTYISLTETNEAKDFSDLFSERWLETLSARYPKIDVTSYLPYMDSILRESGNGIFSDILKVISALNRGLVKTKSIFFDDFYSKEKPIFTTNQVAKLFGNITEIKEPLWIIMVDEIERAQLDEIYRLVEIVERFKNEGRCGLPTKLLFIFCISEPELNNYLDAFSVSDTRAKLLKTFFYEDPKSITCKIFLPPVEPAIRQKYVLDQLNKVIDREGLTVPKEVSPYAIGDPTRSFMKHEDAAEYAIAIIREDSPRIISRITTALDFFYGSFKNRAGELQKNAIRFSDILTLEYIKIKYPYLIDFFTKTVHVLVNHAERNNIDAYFLKKELEEKKINLIGWIELVTERKFTELEKPEVLKMVALVMYYYFDFLNKDYDTKTKDNYSGTTSYPEIMCDYLSLMAEGTETNYRKNNRIYHKHKSNLVGLISSLDNNDLISYARFLYDVSSAPVQLNVDLIQELSNRIVQEKIGFERMNIGDTVLDEAVYQFTFQIVVLTEKERESDLPSENLKKSFISLKNVLSSSKVNTGIKYIILSSLANNERGSGSAIHYRLETAFKKVLRHYDQEMRGLIKSVFLEVDKRYFKGNKILYEYEENFFYTMYQSWSGSKDAIEEIQNIRGAAKRGLKNYPEAIKLYWNKYPVGEGWKTLKDVFDGDRFFSMSDTNNALYMPLETLITITRQAKIEDKDIQAKVTFWNSIKDDLRLKELATIKDEQSTLRSYLIRNGFLDAESNNIKLIAPL